MASLFAVLFVAGLVAAGFEANQAVRRDALHLHAHPTHARSVATAGVVDAYAWLRRQQVQPVTVFSPRRDLAADPPVNETDDPNVGLVREYEIAPNLWGRYEVRLTQAAESFTDGNNNGLYDAGEDYTDANGNGRWDDARNMRDVSAERGQPGNGAVWLIESHGYLFHRRDPGQPLGVAPNDRIAGAAVATEVRRLTLTPPSAAAICVAQGVNATIGSRGRLVGGSGAGLAYAEATGSPTLSSGSEVSGSPSSTALPNFDTSLEAVFGVGLAELKSLADVSTSNSASLNSPIGDSTLNVIEGNATFDAARPLRGTGVVVVTGDCTLADGSNSFFNGLLWVGGDLRVRAPSYLRGVVVVQGDVDVRGVGGDYAEINYDDAILSELQRLMGQYRHSKATYVLGADPGALAGGE